jgi:type III pantothenate kinase
MSSLLAIDAGNTNTVLGLHDGSRWTAQWRLSTEATRTADEYAALMANLMNFNGQSLSDITASVISTVVPQSIFHLRNLCRRYFNCEPIIVQEGHHIGMPIRIPSPGEVGADRLVNAVAAYTEYGGPLVIVDSGTATTFDIVSADGAFEGGIIAPGINLSLRALYEAAAKLPRIAIAAPECVVGRDTVTAMQSGVFWGYVELIEGLVRRIKTERQEAMHVVGTGGVVSLFQDHTEIVDIFDADLTLKGLLAVHQRCGS